MNRSVFVAAIVCVAALSAFGAEKSVVVERFDKVYAAIRVMSTTLDSSVVADFDAELDSLRTADGILLDLRALRPPAEGDSAQQKHLTDMLGRLISRGMELQPRGIPARGEWQYADPVVILCDSAWIMEPLTTAFAKSRDYVDCILSGSEDGARKRLRFLVRSQELMQQERMDRMFEPVSPQPIQK